MRNFLSRFHKDERGNVALITAVGMVGFLGFLALVTDYGMVYLQKQQLKNALDAGALSGIQRVMFGEEEARRTAAEYVAQNGETAREITVDTKNLVVDVTGEKQVDLAFAQVLGIDQATVGSDVQAQAGVTVAGTGFVPIAVPDQVFVYGKLYTLAYGAGDGTKGNYGYLDFPTSNGADGLAYQIENGYDGRLHVGQQVNTKTGINAGKVNTSIDRRIDMDVSDAECLSYTTAASGCDRIMYLPVVDSTELSGTSRPVVILGFAAFYLEQIRGSGGHQEVVGRFIRTIAPGEMGTGNDYGLYSVKLTH